MPKCICPPFELLPPLPGPEYRQREDGTCEVVRRDAGVGNIPGPRSDCPVHGPQMRREEREQRAAHEEAKRRWRDEMEALGRATQLCVADGRHEDAELMRRLSKRLRHSDIDPAFGAWW